MPGQVVAVDLHCGQIQGFFGPRVPVDNLDAGVIGVRYFAQKNLHDPVVVSPDAGGVYRAKKFGEGCVGRAASVVCSPCRRQHCEMPWGLTAVCMRVRGSLQLEAARQRRPQPGDDHQATQEGR